MFRSFLSGCRRSAILFLGMLISAICLGGEVASRPESRTGIGEIRRIEGFSTWAEGVCFSPDGRYLATALGRKGQNATIWHVGTGSQLEELYSESYRLRKVEFSPDGSRLLGCGGFGATLWDAETGKVLKTFRHSTDTLDARFSPDGRRIATGGWDNTVHLWDSRTGEQIRTFVGHGRTIIALAFSPDGRSLASGDTLGKILVWNLATGSGQAVHRLENDGVPFTLEFAPDSRSIAAPASNDVILWDLESEMQTLRLSGHADPVNQAVFSPGGHYLLSCSGQFTVKRGSNRTPDASVRLWDVQTGREIWKFEGHSAYVGSVAFSPDGRLAASAGHDGTVRIWQLPELKEPIPLRRAPLKGLVAARLKLESELPNLLKSGQTAQAREFLEELAEDVEQYAADHDLPLWDESVAPLLQAIDAKQRSLRPAVKANKPDGELSGDQREHLIQFRKSLEEGGEEARGRHLLSARARVAEVRASLTQWALQNNLPVWHSEVAPIFQSAASIEQRVKRTMEQIAPQTAPTAP